VFLDRFWFRRKAVWRQVEQSLASVSAFCCFHLPLYSAAATTGARKTPARTPELAPKGYKVDGELAKRSPGTVWRQTRVIVELRPGAAVAAVVSPVHAAQRQSSHHQRPGARLPNRMIRADVAASRHLPPALRPANERDRTTWTSLTTGTRAVQKTPV